MQLLHPHETEGYREAVRAIRQIGKDCIVRRIKAIDNDEEVPNDILTQIIRVASSDKGVDLEDLVDDFATFYIAGNASNVITDNYMYVALYMYSNGQITMVYSHTGFEVWRALPLPLKIFQSDENRFRIRP